jgi:hypothetical protein
VGSWVLYRPTRYQRELRVRYVHHRQRNVIVAVRVFDARTGAYLRDLAVSQDDDNMRAAPDRATPDDMRRRLPDQPTRKDPPGNADDRTRREDRDPPERRADPTRTPRPDDDQRGRQPDDRSNRDNRGNPQRQADDQPGNRGRQADDRSNRENRGNPQRQADSTRAGNQTPNRNAAGNDRSQRNNDRNAREQPSGNDAPDRARGRGGNDRAGQGDAAQLTLNVNARHFPPDGLCRVWQPGQPAGRQARPRNCNGIASGAPAGAWILRHGRGQPGVILVDYVHERRAGVVVKRSAFDARTGAFLRDERRP